MVPSRASRWSKSLFWVTKPLSMRLAARSPPSPVAGRVQPMRAESMLSNCSTCQAVMSGRAAANCSSAASSRSPLCICRKCGGRACSKSASIEPISRSPTMAPVVIRKALSVMMASSARFVPGFRRMSLAMRVRPADGVVMPASNPGLVRRVSRSCAKQSWTLTLLQSQPPGRQPGGVRGRDRITPGLLLLVPPGRPGWENQEQHQLRTSSTMGSGIVSSTVLISTGHMWLTSSATNSRTMPAGQ